MLKKAYLQLFLSLKMAMLASDRIPVNACLGKRKSWGRTP